MYTVSVEESLLSLAKQATDSERIPVDPIRIAGRLGITIEHSATIPATEAMYSRSTAGAKILVPWSPKDELSARERFTLAHEIGHHLILETGIAHRTGSRKDEEQLCNLFANHVLLPRKELAGEIANADIVHDCFIGADEIPRLAQRFRTSLFATAIALKEFARDCAVIYLSPIKNPRRKREVDRVWPRIAWAVVGLNANLRVYRYQTVPAESFLFRAIEESRAVDRMIEYSWRELPSGAYETSGIPIRRGSFPTMLITLRLVKD